MGAYQQIQDDYKTALKAKDSVKVSVIRMVIAAVKMQEIQKNVKEIGDSDVIGIIQKQVKQRMESITQFVNGNRQDLADKERAELKILETYLPQQLSDDELKCIVTATIAELGATTKADTGKVIKAVMAHCQGKADGKRVSHMVAALLP